MPSVEEMIRSSSCFGVAYDGTVKDCQVCEVRLKCEAKCRLGEAIKPAAIEVATPQEVTHKGSVKANKPSATVLVVPAEKKSKPKPQEQKVAPSVKAPPKKKTIKEINKPTVNYSPDMPSFKDMSSDQLENLAKERGVDPTPLLEKYKAPNILRMRLTMAIKETYVVK